MSLLTDGALGAGFPSDRVHRILSEARAVETGLRMARPGDLVMVFPTSVDAVWKQVVDFKPAAPASVEPGKDAYV